MIAPERLGAWSKWIDIDVSKVLYPETNIGVRQNFIVWRVGEGTQNGSKHIRNFD